jgi:serine phosphatase RsbU (regulator of sigma subunit)
MPALEIATPDGARRSFTLDRARVTIGRARENDLFLPDRWLSRKHAEIRQSPDGYYVVDLGSKNGTLVNRTPVREAQRLKPGDVITLGEHFLTFSGAPVEARSEPTPPEHDTEPAGTQVFSARELSQDIRSPAGDAQTLARQNRVLRVLSDAASALLVHRPLAETFERVLDLLFEAVAAERAAIVLTTPSGDAEIKAERVRQGPPIKRISRSISRRVLTERVAALIPNIVDDMELKGQESIMAVGIRSAVCAPLWLAGAPRSGAGAAGTPDDVIGLVYLDTHGRTAFDAEDLRVVTALANLAAAKIENARLLEESLEKRRLEEDLRVAAEIQARLLPTGAPELSGYGLIGSTRPCHTVGGDYYDFEIDDGQLLLALGDVSGKGMGAALLMAVLRAAVRGQWSSPDIADAMVRINRTLCQNVPANKYVTFFMARLDPAKGVLRYVNAGHNPPALVRASGEIRTLTEGGMVLGLFESVPYEEGTVELGAGDVLLIYSDGVTEAFDEDGEEFGEARVHELAAKHRQSTATEIHDHILQAVEAHRAGGRATDDRTIIVLRRG